MRNGYKMINNGTIQTFVPQEKLEDYTKNGWVVGRLTDVWNKGLTASDPRVAKYIKNKKIHTEEEKRIIAKKISKTLKGKKLKKETIEKRSATRKGTKMKETTKKKISESLKGHDVSKITRNKISIANKGKSHPLSEEIKIKLSIERSSESWQEMHNKIKKERGTFNTSAPEERAYQKLRSIFKDYVVRSYRDIRYKHNCDFYIVPLDLFIELNYHWTHGGKPYDENDEECRKQLLLWQNKKSDFYKMAIRVWTELDVKKFHDFEENKLNYKVFYKEKDFDAWFEGLATKWGEKYFKENA